MHARLDREGRPKELLRKACHPKAAIVEAIRKAERPPCSSSTASWSTPPRLSWAP
jgi:hypothetical protein